MTDDFYVGVHSDASIKSFPSNRSGNFKMLLGREFDLKNIEYKVAISSITRYYETEIGDTVIVRDKRQASIPKAANVIDAYPINSKIDYAEIWKLFLAKTDYIIAHNDSLSAFWVEFTIDGVKQKIWPYSTSYNISESELSKPFKSTSQNGIYFELSNMKDIGTLTVVGSKAITKAVPFRLEFSPAFVKSIFLPQASYSGELTDKKSRTNIELRARNKLPTFTDLRLTLPYIVRMSGDVLPGSKDFQYKMWLYEKTSGVLKDYLHAPFYGNSKSVSALEDDITRYGRCIMHPTIATLFKLPTGIELIRQYVDVFTIQNDVETLYKSYSVSYTQGGTAAKIEEHLKNIGAELPAPHKLRCERSGDVFQLHISEGLRIVLPHAFNSYTFEFTQEGSEWSCTISYYDDASMVKVNKTFPVSYKKSFHHQVAELQKKTQEAFEEVTKETKSEVALKFKINRIKNEQTINSIDIPEGYELQLPPTLAAGLKIKTHINFVNINEYAWITCNLVGETCIGETAMTLLTPTPLKIGTASIVNREYVPVTVNTFRLIELRTFTSLKTLEPFDGPFNVLVTLHFKPKYKRKGYEQPEAKRQRIDLDGRSSRVLQSPTNWGSNSNEL